MKDHGRNLAMVGGSDAHTLKHVAKVYTVARAESIPEFIESIRRGECFAWGEEMRFRDLVVDIYELILAYYGETRSDLQSLEYTGADKTVQLMGRIAGIPTAISGLPAAITSLNYLKQILVSKGIAWRWGKLFDELRKLRPEGSESEGDSAH
jgi:hypothetical protein